MVKNNIKWTMGKLLSAVLLSVMYCVLNIYEGILTSPLSMASHCQLACKHFTLSIQLYFSTAHKTLLTNQYWCCMPRKTSLKLLLYYCTLLSNVCHFDACIIILHITLHNKNWMASHQNNTDEPTNRPFKISGYDPDSALDHVC